VKVIVIWKAKNYREFQIISLISSMLPNTYGSKSFYLVGLLDSSIQGKSIEMT